jgi:hypothetical protein
MRWLRKKSALRFDPTVITYRCISKRRKGGILVHKNDFAFLFLRWLADGYRAKRKNPPV